MIDINLSKYNIIDIDSISDLKCGMIVMSKHSYRVGIVTDIDKDEGTFTAHLCVTQLSEENEYCGSDEHSSDWHYSAFRILEDKETIFWNL